VEISFAKKEYRTLKVLWQSRFLVLLAVIPSIIGA